MPRNTQSAFMFFDVTCGHCQKSTQALSRSYASFKNTTLYFVSMDDAPSIKNFINKYGKTLADKANVFLLEDKKKHFVPLFNPVKFPATFIYDAHNRLVFSSAGDEDLPKILRLLSN